MAQFVRARGSGATVGRRRKGLRFGLLLVILFGCKEPFSFQPDDPTKPDPPAAPILVRPANGDFIPNYAYPQDVEFEWQRVSGATSYQYECYKDSGLNPVSMVYSNSRVTGNKISVRFSRCGVYYWRVRAASPNWNNYTSWSQVFRFILPDPTD
ncbi:MAG: hypothetical protein ACUVUR_05600 [bacterium]